MRVTLRRVGCVAIATTIAVATMLGATGADAAVTCSKWAATTGSDANAGTQAAPYRSLGMLASSLAAGQTGCLPAGQTYYAVAGNGIVGTAPGTAVAPVAITSDPTGRATVKGQLWLKPESHDVVLTGLDFKGGYTETGAPLYTKGSHLILQGDRIGITDNDISDPRGICISAGRAHATDPTVNDVAEDLRVTGNRIHDCGMALDIVWTDQDSGAHGIYLENTLRAVVSDNLIYRNRWRGLQLWPRNDGATIEHNLFDENATHVNIGSSLGPQYNGGFVSQNTTVRDNILTGRVTDFHTSQNPSQLYGYFPDGSPTYGNNVYDNCFAPGDPAVTGNGYALGVNTTAQALFTDRAARDYRLLASSPCYGKGPASIQPAPRDRYVTVSAPASTTTGTVVDETIKVQNRLATAGPVSVKVVTAKAKLLKLTASSGSCTADTCTATLPASESITVSARVGVTAPGSATTTATLGETDATPADNAATGTTQVTGPACTYEGTVGADTVQGTAANEVFCLFDGDDTTMPGAGDDAVLGGPGKDRLSYWNAPSPVIINLTQMVAWDAAAGTAIGWDTLSDVEWGTGTAFADSLIGSSINETLDGLEGADGIRGLGGNDVLKGWSGGDRLYGGDGNDTLDGGDGADACRQDAGAGTITACEG
jgi:Ca2+-binding RTX toxin-like protein